MYFEEEALGEFDFFDFAEEQLSMLPEDATPKSEAILFWHKTDHALETAQAFGRHLVDHDLVYPIPDRWWNLAEFFASMHLMDKTPLPNPDILARSIVDACQTDFGKECS